VPPRSCGEIPWPVVFIPLLELLPYG
jgi:hypothetical protein